MVYFCLQQMVHKSDDIHETSIWDFRFARRHIHDKTASLQQGSC